MKTLLLRLEEDLDLRFSQVCEHEGYQKTGLLRKLIRDFILSHSSAMDPIAEAKNFGIDLGRIQDNLRKSPTERLRDLQEANAFAEKLKKSRGGK